MMLTRAAFIQIWAAEQGFPASTIRPWGVKWDAVVRYAVRCVGPCDCESCQGWNMLHGDALGDAIARLDDAAKTLPEKAPDWRDMFCLRRDQGATKNGLDAYVNGWVDAWDKAREVLATPLRADHPPG